MSAEPTTNRRGALIFPTLWMGFIDLAPTTLSLSLASVQPESLPSAIFRNTGAMWSRTSLDLHRLMSATAEKGRLMHDALVGLLVDTLKWLDEEGWETRPRP